MNKICMKYISCYLVLALFIMGIVPRVYAGFSPSEVVALSQFDRSADLAKIQKILEMKLIRERLDNLGFSNDEIQSRLGQLSDQQIHQLALKLDELAVGGDSTVAIVIIVLLVIALGIFIYLYMTRSRVVITK